MTYVEMSAHVYCDARNSVTIGKTQGWIHVMAFEGAEYTSADVPPDAFFKAMQELVEKYKEGATK